jgi:hypothetical protein
MRSSGDAKRHIEDPVLLQLRNQNSRQESSTRLPSCPKFPGGGISVTCHSTGRHATIGGFIFCESIKYAITVAHVFEPLNTTDETQSCPPCDISTDFYFDDDDETITEGSEMEEVELTSRMSLSSAGSNDQNLRDCVSVEGSSEFDLDSPRVAENEDTGCVENSLSVLQTHNTTSTTSLSSPKISSSFASESSSIPLRNRKNMNEFRASNLEAGWQITTSIVNKDLGSDWALVRPSTQLQNHIDHGDILRRAIPEVLENSPIFVYGIQVEFVDIYHPLSR